MEGRLRLEFFRDFLVMPSADSVGVVNDREWHAVEVEVDGNTASLLVDSSERINASTNISLVTFDPSPEQFYIAGLPSAVQTAIGR